MKGFLQKSNLSSIGRKDKKQLRSRLTTDPDVGGYWYEIDTWLDKWNDVKVEVTKHTPRNTVSRVLAEGSLSNLFD
ncbi:hypothetical protein LCGC14_1062930 [marine sediment metagenome]|uniref:Uncharacterized protein n=1 Tax=marine sediment metagenome TaxID=412755 RepID=A0A0F9MKM5_9ZZZZ